jgi:hypothetical protein
MSLTAALRYVGIAIPADRVSRCAARRAARHAARLPACVRAVYRPRTAAVRCTAPGQRPPLPWLPI